MVFFVGCRRFNGSVKWTSLNPQSMLDDMKELYTKFPFDIIEQYMQRAGISTGYIEKPCLDPKDPQCPDTAPNKHSSLVNFCLLIFFYWFLEILFFFLGSRYWCRINWWLL